MGSSPSKSKPTDTEILLFLTKTFRERVESYKEGLYVVGYVNIDIHDLWSYKKSVFNPCHMYEELKKLIHKPFTYSLIHTGGVHLIISLINVSTTPPELQNLFPNTKFTEIIPGVQYRDAKGNIHILPSSQQPETFKNYL
jgi:hypothetical protein